MTKAKIYFAYILFCFFFAGCDNADDKLKKSIADFNKVSPELKIKTAVLSRLIDPTSALFRATEFSDDNNFACIEYNAKNRLGGYSGWSLALLHEDSGFWIVDEYEASAYQCSRAKLNEHAQNRQYVKIVEESKFREEQRTQALGGSYAVQQKEKEAEIAAEQAGESIKNSSIQSIQKNRNISEEDARVAFEAVIKTIDSCTKQYTHLLADAKLLAAEKIIPKEYGVDLKKLTIKVQEMNAEWMKSTCVI